MNIENLQVGQTFKNYKELCVELGWEVKKSTDTKNAQFKELSLFCKFSKLGHKITIDEIYDIPIPKVENRGKSEGSRNNNSVYGELIQLLILDLLAQKKDGKLTISRTRLMTLINMINRNYGECSQHIKKLAVYTDIEEAVIYDFYNTSNSNFKSAVEIALRNLMDKRIIWYDVITKVVDVGEYKSRLATDEEKEVIRDSEKEILDELGYKQMTLVRISKDWKTFTRKVEALLNERLNISYYFFAYDINANLKHLEDERIELLNFILEEVKRKEYKSELNSTVKNKLIENAQKRRDKGFNTKRKYKFRNDNEYVDKIQQLIDLLISDKSSYIGSHIMNIKLTDEEQFLDDMLFEDLFA